MLNFEQFQVLTFDCYGTMIDWESGLLAALRPILSAHGRRLDDSQIVQLYTQLEPQLQEGEFRTYRDVLEGVVRGFGHRLGFSVTAAEARSLPESLPEWKPFPDTVPALRRLKSQYKLGVISNVDDDLFAASARKLQVGFDYLITAQQARAYKPAPKIFQFALQRIGVARERILHVGQSVRHDVVPAKSLGLAAVWVNRTTSQLFANRPAHVRPDIEVHDLGSLAEQAVPQPPQMAKRA